MADLVFVEAMCGCEYQVDLERQAVPERVSCPEHGIVTLWTRQRLVPKTKAPRLLVEVPR